MEKKYAVVLIIPILIALVGFGSRSMLTAATSDKNSRDVPTKFGLSGLYTLFGTETPDPWEFSLGVYVDYSRLDLPEDPRKPELTEVRFGAALGLIPRFQLGVSVPALDLFLPATNGIPEFSDSGIGDITVSGKYRVINEAGGIPAIALYGLVSFPNGDEKIGLGSGSTDFTLGGILTKHIGPINLYGNVGFFISGYKAGDPNPLLHSFQDSLVYGAGLDFSVAEGNKVNLFAEATFLHEFGTEEEDQVVNLLGIPVEDKVDNPGQLNLGIQLGLSESFVLTGGGGFKIVDANAVPEAPNWRVFGGITYSFKRKPDTRMAQLPPPTPAPPPTQVIPVEPPLVNRCPEITEVTLSAAEISGNERIKISAKATDADNNPLTYQWKATGGEIVGSGGEVIWTAPDCRTIEGPSATYTITVTVSDAQCPVTQTRTIMVRCEKILEGKLPFDKGSARLNNIAKAALDNIAIVLKKFPDQGILIEGHTDSVGNEAANRQMGLRRAESVRNYLITRHGIESKRISIESLGSTRAIAPNDTEEGRRQNRRVEIYRLQK